MAVVNRPYYYNLKDGVPVPVSFAEWAFHSDDGEGWRVARTDLGGGVFVSTVFLGMDHNLFGGGEPILYETMVFGGLLDSEMERYATKEQAQVGHESMVNLVKGVGNEA